jgi:hypothetical protein
MSNFAHDHPLAKETLAQIEDGVTMVRRLAKLGEIDRCIDTLRMIGRLSTNLADVAEQVRDGTLKAKPTDGAEHRAAMFAAMFDAVVK